MAARRIGISQPTASRALARLRELFGDPLLIRTNSGMELTRRAEELVEPLKEWLAHTDSLFAQQVFDPAKIERRFKLASTDFGLVSVIAPAMARLQSEAPGVGIDVVAFSDLMLAKLTSGEIDLIVSGLEPDPSSTYCKHLFRMQAACVMRADHPLATGSEERLTIDEFLAWPHISLLVGENGFDRIGAMLGVHAQRRRVVATAPYFQAAPTLLASTDSVMVLPDYLARQLAGDARFATRKPPQILPAIDYWVLWHERSRRDSATMWLVDLLAESSVDSGGPATV